MPDNVYEPVRKWRQAAVATGSGLVAALCFSAATLAKLRLPSIAGNTPPRLETQLVLALIGIGFGIVAVRDGLTAIFAGVEKRQEVVTWRNLIAWGLYVLILVIFANSLGVALNTLLFGGAIATIVLATLAQAALSGVFAGLVLMLARPYRVGELLYLRTGQFGGAEYEGIVVDIGAFYTTLSSRGELLKVPNTSVITSVLMTRYRPKRAELEISVPGDSLDDLQERVGSRLALAPGSRLRLEPIAFTSGGGNAPTVRLRLEVYSEHPIDTHELFRALQDLADEAAPASRARTGLKTVHT